MIYTRAFLLSVKDSAVCQRLPAGVESSDLCELTSPGLDSDGSSQPLARISDSWRPNNLSQNLTKAPDCACSIGQKDGGTFQLNKSKNPYRPPHYYKVGQAKLEPSASITETTTTASTCGSQEDKLSEKNVIAPQIENEDSSDPVPTGTKKTAEFSSVGNVHAVYSDYSNSSGRVSKLLEPCAARRGDDQLNCDAENVNANIILGASSVEGCGMTANQWRGSFTDFKKKSAPQPLAAACEFEMEDSAKPPTPTEGCNDEPNQNLIDVSKQQSQSSPIWLGGFCTGDDEPHKYLKHIPTQPKQRAGTRCLICLEGFPTGNAGPIQGPETIFSVQTDALYMVSKGSTPKTFGFPSAHGGFSFSSPIPESDKNDLISSSIPENLDLDKDEQTYDSYWADILAILRSEQELDLTPVASNKHVVGSEVHLFLPNTDSIVSVDYQTSIKAERTPEGARKRKVGPDRLLLPHEQLMKSIEYVIDNRSSNHTTADKYVHVSQSEAELSLPDEDSLITLEDLIGPWCSESTGSLLTPCNVNRPPETSVKPPSFIDISASETQQKQHYSLSYPQNYYADFSSHAGSRVRYLDTNVNLDLYCKFLPMHESHLILENYSNGNKLQSFCSVFRPISQLRFLNEKLEIQAQVSGWSTIRRPSTSAQGYHGQEADSKQVFIGF